MRCGVYVRVSTDDQRDNGYSIDSQLRMIKEYCKKNSYDIVDVYNDAGHFGKDLMRPEMQRLLKDIKSHKIEVIVAIKVDRLTRNNYDGFWLLNYCEEHDVKIELILEPYDVSTVQDKKFDIIFDQLQLEKNIRQRIFFDGQIYDAYSIIIDIIKKATDKILIIDNYIDDSVLKMLAKKKNNVEVVILTSDKSNIETLDIKKFNKEYPILKVAKTNKFHDRFIVIDNKEMYHLGASIKDLGKKCFAINKIEDMEIIEKIINI